MSEVKPNCPICNIQATAQCMGEYRQFTHPIKIGKKISSHDWVHCFFCGKDTVLPSDKKEWAAYKKNLACCDEQARYLNIK